MPKSAGGGGNKKTKRVADTAPSQGPIWPFAAVGAIVVAILVALLFRIGVLGDPPVSQGHSHVSAPATPNTPEVLAQQEVVRSIRKELETSEGVKNSLSKALKVLHKLEPYRRHGALNSSRFQYGTEKLVGDSETITAYQKGMLIHGQPVQILDPPSLALPVPTLEAGWAAYNPSVVPIPWRGGRALLVTWRLSTWNLCTWAARGSPMEQLPVVGGKQTVTSRVAAAVLHEDFSVASPLDDVAGLDHEAHFCNHHAGMVRMGVDDGRLFLLRGAPWLLYAAVAPKGQSEYCFHRMFLCELEVPEFAGERVSCKTKVPITFSRADDISEAERKAGRMPNVHQKNWVPFVHREELFLAFTMEPFTVLRADVTTGRCTQVSETPTQAMQVFHSASSQGRHSTMGVHGGSPFIELPSPNSAEQLGIGRIARGNTQYALFFMTIVAVAPSGDSESSGEWETAPAGFRVARVSPIFCLASSSPHHRGLCETIQFAGGLLLDGDSEDANLVVTYGTNDCEAKVAFLPLRLALEMLLPAGGAEKRKVSRSRSRSSSP